MSNLKSFANHFDSQNLNEANKKIQKFVQQCQQDLVSLYPKESIESREQTFEELDNLVISTVYQKIYPLVQDRQQDEQIEVILKKHQFLKPENLEIKEMHISQEKIKFIIAQISKICVFKNPKDKLICIVNACKLVSGMVKHFGFQNKNQGPGADDFLPVLIYVVLKAQPQNPISNLNFIREFYSEDKLSGDIEYYLTAYQSVFEFFLKISSDKLKIDKTFYEQQLDEKTEEKTQENQQPKIDQYLYQNVIGKEYLLKNFEDMTVAELQSLYKEHKKLIKNYKILSKIAKDRLEKFSVEEEKKLYKKQPQNSLGKSNVKRGKTEKDLKNLREEIAILQKLKHQNIILLLDWFETKQDICVVTEYARGELFDILEEDKKLPEDLIKNIACQLVSALNYLHSNRILHRDMKPQNILVGPNNTVKLCDFGFARVVSQSTQMLTSIKGTPLYMAPELVEERPYDYNVDLWSLGIILYELFVGEPPFYTNKLYSLIKLISQNKVSYPKNMSNEFKDFLKGLLHKNPQNRMKWDEILEHPFLQQSNLEKNEIKNNVKNFNIWLKSLSEWNLDFKGFQVELKEYSETSSNQSQVYQQENQQLLFHDYLIKAQQQQKNFQDRIHVLKDLLQSLACKHQKNQIQDVTKENYEQIFSCLNDFINIDFKQQQHNKKICVAIFRICKYLLKNIKENNSLIFLNFVKYGLYFSQFEYSFDYYYQILIEYLRKHDEEKRELEEKHILIIFQILRRYIVQQYEEVRDTDKALKTFKDSGFIAYVFNVQKLKPSYLKDEKIWMSICSLVCPDMKQIILYPVLKEHNQTITGIELNEQDLLAMRDFEEFILFHVFVYFKHVDWWQYFDFSYDYFLKILIKFLRFNPSCIKNFCKQQKLLEEAVQYKDYFDNVSDDIKELMLLIYIELNTEKDVNIIVNWNSILDILENSNNQTLKLVTMGYINSIQDSVKFLQFIFELDQKTNTYQFSHNFKDLFVLFQKCFQGFKNLKWETMYKSEHKISCYTDYGFGDAYLRFVMKIMNSILKRNSQTPQDKQLIIDLLYVITEQKLEEDLIWITLNLKKDLLISLKGVYNLLNLIIQFFTITKQNIKYIRKFCSNSLIRNILGFFDQKNIHTCAQWPQTFGGNSTFELKFQEDALKILEIILSNLRVQKEDELCQQLTNQLQTFPYLIKQILKIYKMQKKQKEENGQQGYVNLKFISLLLKFREIGNEVSKDFCKQKGINFIISNGGLNLDSKNKQQEMIMNEHLNILNQIIRQSTQYQDFVLKYEKELNLFSRLQVLLLCGVPLIQDKAIKTVLYLSKFSDKNFQQFEKKKIVQSLFKLTKNKYPAIKQSSYYNLAQIAYHSSSLFHIYIKYCDCFILGLTDNDIKVQIKVMQCLIHCLKYEHQFIDELINRNFVTIIIKHYKQENSLAMKKTIYQLMYTMCKIKKLKKKFQQEFSKKYEQKIEKDINVIQKEFKQ